MLDDGSCSACYNQVMHDAVILCEEERSFEVCPPVRQRSCERNDRLGFREGSVKKKNNFGAGGLRGGPGGLECGGATVGRTDRRRLINSSTATKIESSASDVISTLLPYLRSATVSSTVYQQACQGTVEREEEEEEATGELLLPFVFLKKIVFLAHFWDTTIGGGRELLAKGCRFREGGCFLLVFLE